MAIRKKTKKLKIKKKVSKPAFDDTIQKTKIRVIGIGGGAGSIVSEIASRIKRADFVVANTDSRALKTVRQARQFQFGQGLTHGLGTGMNAGLGEMAAQAEKEKIKKLFEGQALCIMIVCLGGGAGSGAGPVFAKISKNSGCLTYGIFTLPFEFEGEKKMEIARESLEKMKPFLNAFSVIPNERIFQIIDKNTPLKNALSAINKRLVERLEGLIEMIYLPGLINIDFADLKTILARRGRLTYLNTIEIGEPDKEIGAKNVISSPLYPYTIKGARGILYNIVGGRELQLSEVSQLSKLISDSANKNAKIIFGIGQSPKYRDKIKITLLATGCGMKGILLKPSRRVKPPILKKTKRTKPRRPFRKKGKIKQITPKAVRRSKSKKVKPGVKRKKILAKKKPKIKTHFKKKTRPLPVPEAPRQKPRKKKKRKKKGLRSSSFAGKVGRERKPAAAGKIRRSALQLKKAIEQEEKELLEQEKVWETPAILRRKK